MRLTMIIGRVCPGMWDFPEEEPEAPRSTITSWIEGSQTHTFTRAQNIQGYYWEYVDSRTRSWWEEREERLKAEARALN